MKIKEYYLMALQHKHKSVVLMLDFLINEKKVITPEDDKSSLDRYFAPNNMKRMNQLLSDYLREKRKDPNWIGYSMFRE